MSTKITLTREQLSEIVRIVYTLENMGVQEITLRSTPTAIGTGVEVIIKDPKDSKKTTVYDITDYDSF